MRYFSPTHRAFFAAEHFGAPTIEVPDPEWERPTKQVPDPDAVQGTIEIDGETVADPDWTPPLIDVPDMEAAHPTVAVDNPDCRLPSDAVAVSEETYRAMLEAQAEGKAWAADESGQPVAVDPPAPTEDELRERLRAQRAALIADASAMLDRHRNQKEFGLATTLTDAKAAEWALYLQALRDMPDTAPDLANPVWPVPPA